RGAAGVDPSAVDAGVSRAEARDDSRSIDVQLAAELIPDRGGGHHQLGVERVVRRSPEGYQIRGRETAAGQGRAHLGIACHERGGADLLQYPGDACFRTADSMTSGL